MDPITALGAAGSVVGIVGFGIQLSHILTTFISNVTSARRDILAIKYQVESTTSVLRGIYEYLAWEVRNLENGGQTFVVFTNQSLHRVKGTADRCLVVFWRVEATISCGRVSDSDEALEKKLKDFNKRLQYYTPESPVEIESDLALDTLRVRDRVRFALQRGKLDDYRDQLQQQKQDLQILLQIVTLAQHQQRSRGSPEDIAYILKAYAVISQIATPEELRLIASEARGERQGQNDRGQQGPPKHRPPSRISIFENLGRSNPTKVHGPQVAGKQPENMSPHVHRATMASQPTHPPTPPRSRTPSANSRGNRSSMAGRSMTTGHAHAAESKVPPRRAYSVIEEELNGTAQDERRAPAYRPVSTVSPTTRQGKGEGTAAQQSQSVPRKLVSVREMLRQPHDTKWQPVEPAGQNVTSRGVAGSTNSGAFRETGSERSDVQITSYVITDDGAYQLPISPRPRLAARPQGTNTSRQYERILAKNLALLSPKEMQAVRLLCDNKSAALKLVRIKIVQGSRLKFWTSQERIVIAFVEGQSSLMSKNISLPPDGSMLPRYSALYPAKPDTSRLPPNLEAILTKPDRHYRVWTIHPYASTGTARSLPDNWSKCTFSEEFLDIVEIRQQLELLDRDKSSTVLQKMANLGADQQLQVWRVLQASRQGYYNQSSLRQLSIVRAKGPFRRKAVRTIVVYVAGSHGYQIEHVTPGYPMGVPPLPGPGQQVTDSDGYQTNLHAADLHRQRAPAKGSTIEGSLTADENDVLSSQDESLGDEYSEAESEEYDSDVQVRMNIRPPLRRSPSRDFRGPAYQKPETRAPSPRPPHPPPPFHRGRRSPIVNDELRSPRVVETDTAGRKKYNQTRIRIRSNRSWDSDYTTESYAESAEFADEDHHQPSAAALRKAKPSFMYEYKDSEASDRSEKAPHEASSSGWRLLRWYDDAKEKMKSTATLKYPEHFDKQRYDPRSARESITENQEAIEQLLLEWTPNYAVQRSHDGSAEESIPAKENPPGPPAVPGAVEHFAGTYSSPIRKEQPRGRQTARSSHRGSASRGPKDVNETGRNTPTTAVESDGSGPFIRPRLGSGARHPPFLTGRNGFITASPLSASPRPVSQRTKPEASGSRKPLNEGDGQRKQGETQKTQKRKTTTTEDFSPKPRNYPASAPGFGGMLSRAATFPLAEGQTWSSDDWARQIVKDTARATPKPVQNAPRSERRHSNQTIPRHRETIREPRSSETRRYSGVSPRQLPTSRRTNDEQLPTRSFERVSQPPRRRQTTQVDERPERRERSWERKTQDGRKGNGDRDGNEAK